MKRVPLALALFLAAAPAVAQDQAPVYQPDKQHSFEFKFDALLRQEWTRDLFADAPNQDRWRIQARPRLELGAGPLKLGVGGEFNYSEDENVEPKPALLRDNYKSREARLDLAFAAVNLGSVGRLEGGRFFMPVAFTEMIWDRDLRPQGASLTLHAKDAGGIPRFGVTALWSRGSHVFDDQDAEMWIGSAFLSAASGRQSRFELTASYVEWRDIAAIEPMIRRQNTRIQGDYVLDYKVVDLVARIRNEGAVPTQLVADYCWNTAVDADRSGLWLALAIGSIRSTRSRLEYTYAKVDKDATLAAYASDDFFWSTGWEGHRGDLGFRLGERSSLHGVGEIVRFKDSPRPEERDHWIRRYRAELRVLP